MSEYSKPAISVVIPIYNPNPTFFSECLESILKQSHDDFEIIISDDDTTDQSRNILRHFPSEKIKYRHNPGPKGIFSNLNHALQCSAGEYLQIFCQDDRMYPDYLARQQQALQKYPSAVFVYAQCDVIDERGDIKAPCANPGTPGNHYLLVPAPKAINCFFKYGCLPGNLSTVMMRRKLYEELGPFNVNYPYAGDFKYWVDAILRHDFVINLVPLLNVRNHEKQASQILGAGQWTADTTPIYNTLLDHLNIRKSRLYARLFINENFGVQSFYAILKAALLKQELARLTELSALHKRPFNLWLIALLFLITLRQRIRLFKLEEISLFDK
ncbi:MAG: glycosyltransferase [Saprospiraceae bacterium]|nr:MAG: glycosyltransferase [Saprospiraceae bacterium]